MAPHTGQMHGMTSQAIIRMGPEDTIIGTLELDDMDEKHKLELERVFGKPPNIPVQRMCTADEFKAITSSDDKLTRVLAKDLNAPDNVDKPLSDFLDFLRMNVAGGVVIKQSFLVLIYPPKMEAWNFIDTLTQSSSGSSAKVQLFRLHPEAVAILEQQQQSIKDPEKRDEGEEPPSLPYDHHIQNVFKDLIGIDMKKLLSKSSESVSTANFYLLFPSAVSDERELYVDFLTKSGVKNILSDAQTGLEWKPGPVWEGFRSRYEQGVILIHPSFIPIYQIPKLYQLVRKDFSIFEFGINTDDASMPKGMNCTRLFPHGGAILITTATVLQTPIIAYESLKLFTANLRTRAPNTWKLVTRPDLKEWVLKLAGQNTDAEHEAAIAKHGNDTNPKFKISDATAALFKMHILLNDVLDEHWATQHFLAQLSGWYDDDAPIQAPPFIPSPHPSTGPDEDHRLAAWFCGWALTKRTQFRRFTIVDPGARESLRFGGHVDVITSHAWYQLCKKDSKPKSAARTPTTATGAGAGAGASPTSATSQSQSTSTSMSRGAPPPHRESFGGPRSA
ncbi:MAG: hypothetical protein M1816_002512 [Peltula sp. TS41687]|nr:MAG: hypothetical protein M1816_002512 [Peltula sp. TS41687]